MVELTEEKIKALEKQGIKLAQIKSHRGPTISEEAAQVEGEIQREIASSVSLTKKIFFTSGVFLLFYILLVILFTLLFSFSPLETAEWLGYVSKSTGKITSEKEDDKSNVLAASTSITSESKTTPFQALLQPVGKVSLGIVRFAKPDSYAEVAKFTILDPNEILIPDENGAIVPTRPINLPESSLLQVGDSELVTNLNSDLLQGRRPGTSVGDIAIVGDSTLSTPTPIPQIINQVVSGLTNSNLSGSAEISNANLANSDLIINTSGPLTGGGTLSLGGTVTLDCPTCIVSGGSTFTATSTDILTNKTIDALSNTITDLSAGNLASGDFSSKISSGTYSINVTGNAATAADFTGTLSGDVTGTQGATIISTLTSSNFASSNISQWTNDSSYITAASADTLTNKSISGLTNTITNISNSSLINSSVSVLAGTGLSGGGIVSLGGSTSLSLPVVGVLGTYGDAVTIPVITTDAQGRVSVVTPTAISGLTISNFGSSNISQWVNNSGYITATSTDVLSAKTIAAGVNTISGLTNSNLSGTAGITNANLANSGVTINTTSPIAGGGAVSLGGVLTLTCPTCSISGGNLFSAAATSGSNSAISQGGTLTFAAGTNLTTTNNATGTITFATSATPTFTTVNGLAVTNNGSNTLNIASGKSLGVSNSLTFTGVDGTSFVLPGTSDDVVGRIIAQTIINKTIAAGSNTITGLTNSNLSGSAGITNANLSTSNITTAGNSGSGSVSLGGGLTFTGGGITNIAASGSTLTVTSTEADTLSAVTGRGATTATALILNGGIATTTTTLLSLDSGTTGGVSLGTGSNAKTVTVGNTTGLTTLNLNSGTGNINLQVAGIATTGNVQIGAGGAGSTTPDLLTLDLKSSSGDPTGTNGAIYYNSNTNKFRCFENSAWANCITPPGNDLQHAASYDNNEAVTNIPTGGAQVMLGTVSITPTSATGDVYVTGWADVYSSNGTDQPLQIVIETTSNCTGSTVGNASVTYTITSGASTVNDRGTIRVSGIAVDTGASAHPYSLCAAVTSGAGDSDILNWGIEATVIDTGADVAEIYTTNDSTLEPGDVVSFDSSLKTGIKKSVGSYDSGLLGVVTTNPGLVIGGVDKEGVKALPIALSGRIPVKVSTQNGAIEAGDYLTSSEISGIAMKATHAGPVIGMALSGFNGDGVGSVLTFIKSNSQTLSSETPNNTQDQNTVAEIIENMFKNLTEFLGSVIFHSDVTFLGRPMFNKDTTGNATIKAGDNAVFVNFEKEYSKNPVVTSNINLSDEVSVEEIPVYAIYNISRTGFTIKLSKAASIDFNFSWVAFEPQP